MGWTYQGPVRIGLILLGAFVLITDARECKINCHGSSGNLLKFEPGKVYNYKLEGVSVTTLAGASGEASRLSISADAQVAVLSGCEHVLKITNVQTSGNNGKKYNLDKLSQQPIKFGLQNGRIETELCANDAEDNVGLNIKRAVLSMIQSSVLKDNGYGTQSETDVFGICPTGFEFSKSGSTVTVVKTRDLNKCAFREDLTIPFLSAPYYTKSDVQTSPLLSSSFRSEQKIEGGTLKSAYLEEQYQYKPGGSLEATSKVTVKTRLTFANAAPGAIPASCTVPRSIIFEQEHAQEGYGISNKIVELVKQGCESRVIGHDTAQKFSQLVRSVAAASKSDINAALQHVKSGPGIKDRNTAQKMLLDAIVMAQSAGSVEVLAEMLKKKEVTGNTARLWLLSLGAAKHASRSSLMAVLPLLDGEPDVNAYLGIGSLAGKFCRDHACDGVNEVNQLQIKLGAPLLKGCKCNSKREEDHIIASLKGLGNIKYLGPKIAGKIVECAQDEEVHPRIRVAALETIASDPNKDQFKTLALNILKNTAEDSEVRIKAYLVLAKCPCGKVAGAIKDILSTEESNQVGGYIVSHLRNLQASTNPDKAMARHHLGNIIPPRRFPIDPRRYSINQEISYSADIVNTGASGEVDIIYSQNSFFPRSLSLNLTTQFFGTAFNLFQIDARAENLEHLAEKLFGPKGYLKTNDVEDMYEDSRQAASSIIERIASRYDSSLRPKRSISRNQLNNIASKVHLPKSSDDIDLDLSLKVLGSEVAWSHIHGSDIAKIHPEDIVDEYFNSFDHFIQALKNSDVDYRRHITFLDREITYPTGMGLALRLKTLGTAALRLKFDGKIDIPAIIRDPKNTDIRFQLVPSAAINLNGEIVVDGVAVETGVRVDLNVHSSTGSDLTFRLLNGRGVDVKLGLPLPKQEIVSVTTKVNSVVRDDSEHIKLVPVKYDTARETYSGCFDQLNEIVGLTFCGEVSIPFEQGKPIYPLYGPINMAVSIDKEDESLLTYHFKALYDHKEDTKTHSLEFLLDTPNSKSNRRLGFTFEGSLLNPKKYVVVNLESPWTRATLDAQVVDDDDETSVNAKLIHDGQEYSARLGAKRTDQGKFKKVEPLLEYKMPEPAKSALIGKKGGPKQKTQSFNTIGHILVEKNPGINKRHYELVGLGISTPKTEYVVDGIIHIEPDLVNADLKLSYEKEHVTIKNKLQRSPEHIHGSLEMVPTQYADLGVSVTFDNKFKLYKEYDYTLVIVHGPDPKSKTSRIYLHQYYDYSGAIKDGTLSTTLSGEVTYPVVKLDSGYKLRLKPKFAAAGIHGKFDKYSGKFESAVEIDSKTKGDYQANLDIEFMDQGLNLLSSRSVEAGDKSRFTNLLILKPGGSYQANALVTHRITEKEVQLSIEADASMPNKPGIKLNAALNRNSKKCQSKIKLDVGTKCFIDGSTELIREPNLSGNFKLMVPGYVETEGKLNTDGAQTNALATLSLPKADRKMEAKVDFTTSSPKYSGVLSVCYDTKDPKKTLKIQTDNNVVTKEGDYSIDSKNTISLDDLSLQINGKGKSSGSVLHGSQHGEAEVIFPNGYHVGGKYNENINLEGKNKEVESIFELYDHPKGQEPQKLKFTVTAKHLDPKAGTIDGQVALTYLSRDKKDVSAHAHVKKLPSGPDAKTFNLNGQVGLSGSLVETPVSFNIESELSNEYFNVDNLKINLDDSLSVEYDLPFAHYNFHGSVGNDIKVNGNGKLNGPTISNEISGTFPQSSTIKNFKIVSNNVIDINDDSKEHKKVKLNNAVHWNDNRHVQLLLEGHCEDNGVQFSAEYETEQIPKRRVTGSAHYSGGDNLSVDGSLNLIADGKNSEISFKGEVNKKESSGSFHIAGNLPEVGKIDLAGKTKGVKEGRGVHTEMSITHGNKKGSGIVKVELEPNHPLIDVDLNTPDGPIKALFKADKKGERHYASEVEVRWPYNKGGHFCLDNELNLESVDNFLIKSNVESSALEADKFQVEIANRPAKGEAKKITFQVKEGDKLVASGSSNYNFKEEGDVAVLEGNGNIKYKDQSYPINFHATRQRLENGEAAKINVKAGKMTLNIEQKSSPEEYSFERTFCKEAKSCTKMMISSVAKTTLETDEYSINVHLDLSQMSSHLHDLTYKSNYKRDKLIVDHNVELQWGPGGKLQSHGFIHETSAGYYFTFPKRTIGGEIKYDTRQKDNTASLRVATDLHINKGKEPKLSLVAATTTVYEKGTATIAGELKAVHPSFGKDLVAKGQIAISDKPSKLVDGLFEIDVSPDSNNKVNGKLKFSATKELVHTLVTVTSKGCHIDVAYEEKIRYLFNGKDSSFLVSESITYLDSKNSKKELLAKFEASGKKMYGVVKLPSVLLEGDLQFDKGYAGTFDIFGKKYHDSLTYNKDTNVFKYQLTGLSGGKSSLTVEGGGKIGGSGVFRASIDNKKACSFDVALDEGNFLKSKYSYDTDVVKSIYALFTNEISSLSRDCSKSLEAVFDRQMGEAKKLVECLSKARPNLKGFVDHMKGQLKQIRNEAENSKSLQDAAQLVKDISGSAGVAVAKIFEELLQFVETIDKLLEDAVKSLKSMLHEIEPKLKASYNRLSKVFNDLLEQYLKLSAQLFDLVLDEIKKHEEDIKRITSTFIELVQDVGQQIGQLVITFNKEMDEIIAHNVETLKELPIVNLMQEKWNEMKDLKVPDEVFNLLHELFENLKQLLPTNEASQFVDTFSSVLEQVLKHEDIKNRDDVLKQLYKEFVAAIKSLMALVAQNAPQTGLLKPTKMQTLPYIHLLRIPTGGVRASLINLFSSQEFLPIVQGIVAGVRMSLDPLDNIPPFKGLGYIIGGSEVITFDGVHLAVPAPCTYVLSEDYKHRNFSVAAQLASGALKSLTVSSQKDSVEIRPNGHVSVNGKDSALPVMSGELVAFRKPGVIGVWSKAGVLVMCSIELDECSVKVNGYYFGRVRGLLGNLNGEQYDERLTPQGKIVKDTGEVADAWKVDPSCPSGSNVGHKHVRSPQCTQIFADDVETLLCRPFVNPAPFRDACDHLAASKTPICLAAQMYTFACRDHGVLLAQVPDSCASCKINGKSYESGFSEQITPKGEADIVVVAELLKDNEQNYKQIAVPLVEELKSQLNKAGISDIRVTLIGGKSPRGPYSSFFTNKQGEVTFDPSSNNVVFEERPVLVNDTSFIEKVHAVYKVLSLEEGGNSMYKEALETPFVYRPNAYKLLLGVHGQPYKMNVVSGKQVFKLIDLDIQGIQYSVITPFSGAFKDTKDLNAAVLNEKEAILVGGEKVPKADYLGTDVHALAALESEGSVISSDIANAPNKQKLIHLAADQIVSSLTSAKWNYECECSLYMGFVPYPECISLE